ncbi:hypothetical protein ABBQ32_010004 [Trebouxia sp. C0010 RCD-2024]
MKPVLFCSHKGGPGKTSLLSHTVSQWAQTHPDRKVLLIDCSVPADVTRLVLGGDHDFKGEENFDKVLELQPRRTATALFERCASANSQAAAAPSRGWLSRKAEPQSALQGVSVDVESYIVKVSDYNPAVPCNVYLAAGGPGKSEIVSFTTEQQRAAAESLQHSLASLAVYDVFVDTDGDLSFSDYTRIALMGSAGLIVVPSEASFTDYNRLLTFCEELKLLHTQAGSAAKLLAVTWNKVNVQKHVPCLPVSSTLTPTKAVQELVGTLNQHLAQKVTLKYADLFVYPAPEDRDFSKFIEAVTMVVQDFGVAGFAAQDLGMPFATMKPGMLHGGQMPYDIKADKLERLQENIMELVFKIDKAPQ